MFEWCGPAGNRGCEPSVASGSLLKAGITVDSVKLNQLK